VLEELAINKRPRITVDKTERQHVTKVDCLKGEVEEELTVLE